MLGGRHWRGRYSFLHQRKVFSYGLQAKGMLYSSKNDQGYRLGDEAHVNFCCGVRAGNWVSFHFGLGYTSKNKLWGMQEGVT